MNSEMGFSLRTPASDGACLRDDPRGARHWGASSRRTLHMRVNCQAVVFWVFLPVLCSERERPFFVPSPAIRFPERAEGVKGPKR